MTALAQTTIRTVTPQGNEIILPVFNTDTIHAGSVLQVFDAYYVALRRVEVVTVNTRQDCYLCRVEGREVVVTGNTLCASLVQPLTGVLIPLPPPPC